MDAVDIQNVTLLEKVVKISWTSPLSPNGFILLFDIELIKVDVHDVSYFYIFKCLFDSM